MKPILLAFIVALIFWPAGDDCFSQENIRVESPKDVPLGVAYRKKQSEDGSYYYEFSSASLANRTGLSSTKFTSISKGPFRALIESVEQKRDLSAMSDIPLTEEQKEKVVALVENYKADIEGKNPREQAKIYKRFQEEIREVLLDEQLLAIRRTLGTAQLFKFILSDRGSEYLELTPAQKMAISQDCDSVNKAVTNALKEVARIKAEQVSRLQDSMGKLSEDQLNRLREIIGRQRLDDGFEEMSLKSLKSTTDIGNGKGRMPKK